MYKNYTDFLKWSHALMSLKCVGWDILNDIPCDFGWIFHVNDMATGQSYKKKTLSSQKVISTLESHKVIVIKS